MGRRCPWAVSRTLVALLVVAARAGPASAYYVALGGSDANAGLTEDEPLRTLQACVDLLRDGAPGAECILRGGEWADETVFVEHLAGTRANPYVIRAYDGETVTFSGTRDVEEDAGSGRVWTWTAADLANGGAAAGHWSVELPPDFPDPWQLFIGDELYMNARWPNGRWDDKSAFSAADSWAFGSADSVYVDDTATASTMVDSCCGSAPASRRSATGMTGPSLAASGVDATGASAVLNTGHWFTYAAPVDNHARNTGSFTYRKQPGWILQKYVAAHDGYYLENKLEFLDTDKEWFFDRTTRRLHLLTPGSANPNTLRVRARIQEYAIRCTDTEHLKIKNVHFFGTTLWIAAMSWNNNVEGITLDSLTFRFPSAQKRMLGIHDWHNPTTLYQKDDSRWNENVVYNCTFTGAEADPVLYIAGAGNRLENNAFDYNDWSAVTTKVCWPPGGGLSNNPSDPDYSLRNRDLTEAGCTGKYGGGAFALIPGGGTKDNPTIIRRNTLTNIAVSAGIKLEKNSLVELNHMYNHLDIQLDGAMIQGGVHDIYEKDFRSSTWFPRLCDDDTRLEDATECGNLPGCSWDGVACSGYPTTLDDPPASALTDANRYGFKYVHNWLHHSRNYRTSKRGMRFDRAQHICSGAYGNTWGFYGEMTGNVLWQTAGLMVKGNNHKITRNLIFGSGQAPGTSGGLDDEGSSIYDITMYHWIDEGTCQCTDQYCIDQFRTCCANDANGDPLRGTYEGRDNLLQGNAMESFKGATGGGTASPDTSAVDAAFDSTGTMSLISGNSAGALYDELRDPQNWDFRPKVGSNFLAASIGPYDLSDPTVYRIPGRRTYRASTPVPPDGATDVQLDADLMFLPGLEDGAVPVKVRHTPLRGSASNLRIIGRSPTLSALSAHTDTRHAHAQTHARNPASRVRCAHNHGP